MQSKPSAVPQSYSTEPNPSETRTLDQHGLLHNDADVSLSPAVSAEPGTTTEQVAADAVLAASLQEGGDVLAQSNRRLSPQSTPSPPAGYNRISEYEKASTPPIKRKQGPGFEVINKYRSPGDKSSPIQELPNGLSYT